MKKIILLSAAVAAIVASHSVQAAESVTIDPSLKLTYKNFYWKGKNEEKNPEVYRDEWVHGIVADFDTGYINDMIGFVGTAGFADPISVGNDITYSNIATNTKKDGANGISGIQQAYLQAKYTLGKVDLYGSYGVKKRSFALYSNSSSRLLAASSQGIDLSAEFMGLTVYGTQIDGASDRNASAFVEDMTVNADPDMGMAGDELEHIQIFGAEYDLMGVGLKAEYLNAKDYIKKQFVMADYTFDLGNEMSVYTDARFAKAKSGGDLMEQESYKSNYINLNAALNVGNAYVGFGYSKVEEGDWITDNADQGNNGTFDSSTSLWEDYVLEGEKGYVLSAGYNFADFNLPGLSFDFYIARGDEATNFESDFERKEWSTNISYAFDGQLDGLAVRWAHINYEAQGTSKTAADNIKTDEKINRLYLTYTKAIF